VATAELTLIITLIYRWPISAPYQRSYQRHIDGYFQQKTQF